MFDNIILQKSKAIESHLSDKKDVYNLFELIFNPNIEQAVKSYITAEVDWWIYEERLYLESNERFNLNDPKLKAFLFKYDDLLKKNAFFNKNNLLKIINDAYNFRLNYLMRPRLALKWFVYRWEMQRPYNEIIKRLNYISDYQYLTDGFKKYIFSNSIIENEIDLISASKFEKIISEIDNEYINELSPSEFLDLCNPLFEFFNKKTKISNTEKIPVEPIITFLEDKNINIFAEVLKNSYNNGELINISKKYFLGMIYKTLYDLENMYDASEDIITNLNNEISENNFNFSDLNLNISEIDNYSIENNNISSETISENEIDVDKIKKELKTQNEEIDLNDKILDENENILPSINEEITLTKEEQLEDNNSIDNDKLCENYNNAEQIENSYMQENDQKINQEEVASEKFDNIYKIFAKNNNDNDNILKIEQAIKGKNQILIDSISNLGI